MSISRLHTLVNFRAYKPLLKSFDEVCCLSGKTRTQLIIEMMNQQVKAAGPNLAAKFAAQKAAEERILKASEAQSKAEAIDPPRQWSSAVFTRLKPFSSFGRG